MAKLLAQLAKLTKDEKTIRIDNARAFKTSWTGSVEPTLISIYNDTIEKLGWDIEDTDLRGNRFFDQKLNKEGKQTGFEFFNNNRPALEIPENLDEMDETEISKLFENASVFIAECTGKEASTKLLLDKIQTFGQGIYDNRVRAIINANPETPAKLKERAKEAKKQELLEALLAGTLSKEDFATQLNAL